MAILHFAGFESGSPYEWYGDSLYGGYYSGFVGTTGTSVCAVDSGTKRTGGYSLKISPQSGNFVAYWGNHARTTGCVKVDVRITARPATTARMLLNGISPYERLLINADGTLTLQDSTGASHGTTTTALTDTTRWYRIEVRVPADGSASSELRIDGRTEFTFTHKSLDNLPTWLGNYDNVADTYTAYFDDFVIADAAHGWIGPTAVYHLLPTADAQRGSWTGGSGGTTNLWDAINNVPPAGTATETNTTQIESADSSGDNSTDEYRATTQTIASVVGTGASVLAMSCGCFHGEDVATGTKTGSIALTSPTISATTFTFGQDLAALGTYPDYWQWRSPAPITSGWTNNTAPVIVLRKTDATTRVGSVCFAAVGVVVQQVSDPLPRRPMRALLRR